MSNVTNPAPDGRLERVGDRWRLRFQRALRHPPERVWRALTSDDDLAVWFPARIEGGRTRGAELRFVFPDDQPGGDGEITVWDPPSVLEFRWATDTFRFEVAPTPDGCTLTMSQVFSELGKAARDGAGWAVCLDELGYHLDSRPAPAPARSRWERAHAALIDRFGPETATIGVPEGHRWEDES